ncbi:MAG TPA: S1 RNA-binding domain-containing protein [Patescibacteria group bacterium]|nr:S1 RNA-binding domain-containing protein [Patescibacteria group bacterium]
MAKAKVSKTNEVEKREEGNLPADATASAVAGGEAPKKEKKVRSTQAPVRSEKPATSMDELLERVGKDLKTPHRGQITQGIVNAISRKTVQIDVGGKTEGIVTDKEFESAEDYIKQLHVGDVVNVYVVSTENDRGQMLLSLKRAAMDQKWDIFTKDMNEAKTVEVKGLELNKGGMVVLYEGIRGFIPTSQFGKSVINNLDSLLGHTIAAKIIEVEKDKNRLIFSERHVSEQELMKQKTVALDAIVVGETYEGTVSGIMPFGAFVTVNVPLADKEVAKVEGLVHISEISWEKVEDPSKYLTAGQEIKVKVLGVDQAAGKLNLSVKQLEADPWSSAAAAYPDGSVVSGTVSRVAQFGVFVRLGTGIDGLIHRSKLTEGDMPRVGEDVSVTVESVDPAARRISLSLTPTEVPMGYK